LIVGGCTTFVNFALFTLLTEFLHYDVTVSNVISIAVSILFAYVTNKLFVFHNHCKHKADLMLEFSKFIGSRLTTMAVEVGGVLLFVNVLGQDSMIGKIETQVVVIAGNYFISKFLVFRKNKLTEWE
jgi:putative flippase GtrA